MLDRELLGNTQGSGDAAAVDENAVVDEEGRRAMPEPFASEGAEHAKFHETDTSTQK